MRRSKPESLGNIIDGWLKKQQKHSHVHKANVVNNWASFVGITAARYTESVRFEDDTLMVRLNSAVARRELEMIRTPLIERINQQAGEEIVKELRFSS